MSGRAPATAAELEEAPVRLEADQVSVRFGERWALSDVSLAFPEGSVTAIVGPSGCGKSSFLQTLNRLTDLVPGCRTTGRVLLDGEDIAAPGVDQLSVRRRIGMIFQKPNPFPLSIHRNFELPLREHGIRARSEIEARIEASLRSVGLWEEVEDRLENTATRLSGGQQQRLCLARALALDPEVVLLDEPCSALDPLSSAVVEDLIASLGGRYTVIVVTHNLPQARRIADRIALFWVVDGTGRLIEVAETETFFERPHHRLTRDYVSGARG